MKKEKLNLIYNKLFIDDSWSKILDDSFNNELKTIINYLKNLEDSNIRITPDKKNIFKAFSFPLEKLKVVILGQDPYPRPGVATGIAFGVPDITLDTETLSIIRGELSLQYGLIDIDDTERFDYTLESWKDQGVLLLNTALTTENWKIGAHFNIWRPFITNVIKRLSDYNEKLIFVMMGKKAQYYDKYIDNSKNYIMHTYHPSVDQYIQDIDKKKFTGCRVFGNINKLLEKDNKTTIDWYIK